MDVFTKALPHQAFAIHLDTLFGIPPTAHLTEYLRIIKLQRKSGFKIPMYKNDTADMHEQYSDFSDGLLHGFSE